MQGWSRPGKAGNGTPATPWPQTPPKDSDEDSNHSRKHLLCSSEVSRHIPRPPGAQSAAESAPPGPGPAGRSELLIQLQALVLPGAPADRGGAASRRPAQVVLDGGGAVQPLHEGHEVVQLLQAAVLLLKQLQDSCCRAALAGQEPGGVWGQRGALQREPRLPRSGAYPAPACLPADSAGGLRDPRLSRLKGHSSLNRIPRPTPRSGTRGPPRLLPALMISACLPSLPTPNTPLLSQDQCAVHPLRGHLV